MANKHETLGSLFSDIADSIRAKTGSTGTIVADNFPEEIDLIDTQEDLDPELTEQDAKIAELQELLQGKAVPAPEDLTEELAAQSEIIAEQDELITQLASALEGKAASGGASVDTSTVTIYDNSGFLYRVIATTFENDMTNSFFFEDGFSENSSPDFSNNGGTIHNVIRNSVMIIQTDVVCHPDVCYGADWTLWQEGIYSFVITDEVANIELYDNGEQ